MVPQYRQTVPKLIRGKYPSTALLKDTPKPLRVFFYPACHQPALTGGVIFCGKPRRPAIAWKNSLNYEKIFSILWWMNLISCTTSNTKLIYFAIISYC